jgi:phosphoribosyl 1,2-cyclic phosphate phosphodiesterase
MDITILGSGGCMVTPKPLCQCRICKEARAKGIPYTRTGPSAFIHEEDILIDTPAEIAHQINRSRIRKIDHLLLSHLDPDHVEGLRVLEQISLDFRSWRAYPEKGLELIIPDILYNRLKGIHSVYGPLIDYYEDQGFVKTVVFQNRITVGETDITAIPVDCGSQISFVYIFENEDKRVVYAPCDIKPFPSDREEVQNANLLIIQPGIFETGLKHGFTYPENHISRTTLYTFDQTMKIAKQVQAKEVLFVHLEEYWNRGYDDYLEIEKGFNSIRFAYDGMNVKV